MKQSRLSVLYLLGVAMPYVAVGMGLHVLQSAWAAILGYHLGILTILWLVRYPRPTHPSGFTWQAFLFGMGGSMAGVILFFLWPHLPLSSTLPASLANWGLTRPVWPWFIGYSALVNPWLEEIYWRGWLGSALHRPIWNDALFAGFHLVILAPFLPFFWLVIAFLVLAFSGWMWRQVTRRSDSLVPSAFFHLFADVSILLVIVSEVL